MAFFWKREREWSAVAMRDKEHRPHLPALWRERKWEGRGEERRESEPLHRCRRSSVIRFPSERERTFIEEFENI